MKYLGNTGIIELARTASGVKALQTSCHRRSLVERRRNSWQERRSEICFLNLPPRTSKRTTALADIAAIIGLLENAAGELDKTAGYECDEKMSKEIEGQNGTQYSSS